MPTHPLQALTTTAIDVVDELSLADGAEVAVQVRGQRPARYAEAAAAPDAGGGNEVLPGRWAYFTVGALPVWWWSSHADGAAISVND